MTEVEVELERGDTVSGDAGNLAGPPIEAVGRHHAQVASRCG